MHNLLHFVIRRLCSGDSASCPPLADATCRIRCCMATKQLLHGDKAIAAWRCSNQLLLVNPFVGHGESGIGKCRVGPVDEIDLPSCAGDGGVEPAEVVGREHVLGDVPLVDIDVLPLSALSLVASDGVRILDL